MIPRFDVRPRDRRTIRLFANTGEAIVFWLSVAGVVFLGLLYLFRFLALEPRAADVRELEKSYESVMSRLESLERRLVEQDRLIEELRGRIQRGE